MDKIILYADGACSGNPGKGAYASIICIGDTKIESAKAFRYTTNNRMELLGVIEPIEKLKKATKIEVFTDSKYIVDAINQGWLSNWIKNNWKKSNRKKVLNIDLWIRMRLLIVKHNISFNWVRGHSGHPDNERCDVLAVETYNGSDFNEDKEYTK